MAEQKIERTELPALFARGYILHMSHLFGLKHNRSRHNLFVRAYQIKTDILGKTPHQQLHLFQRMHRFGVVIRLQHMLQQGPVFCQGIPFAFNHTVNVKTMIHRLARLAQTQSTDAQWMALIHHRADQSTAQLPPCTEQGIQVFARRIRTIYIRYRLVHDSHRTQIVLIIQENQLHHLQHLFLRHIFAHNQSAIGQPLVRVDAMLLLHPVGGKHRLHAVHVLQRTALFVHDTRAVKYQHGTIKETVGMIIHKAPLNQKCAVLGCLYKLIPHLSVIDGIRNNGHKLTNLRNSS